MSSYQLSFQLYKWLSGMQLIGSNHRYKASGNFQLDLKTAQSLLSGFALSNLIITIGNQKGIKLNQTLLTTIKNSNTTAAKTYNWNILQQSFMKLGISLPKEMQKDIAAGNFATLVQFLMKIKSQVNPKKAQKQRTTNRDKQFDVKNIKNLSQPQEGQSVLELVVFLISKHFNLTPKQAVSTLSQNGKYFAHMVVKGIKGSHIQVIQLYAKFYQHMSKLLFLAQKDPQRNTQFILQLLKPSLISRDQDVTKVGCMALQAFIQQSLKYNSKNLVYQILCKDQMGFDFIYMGIKRHPSLVNQIFSFVYVLIRDSLKDFFEIQFHSAVNNQQQYLRSIITLLPAILSHPQAKDLLMETKTTQLWIQNCEHMLEKNSTLAGKKHKQQLSEQIKLLYLELLCQLWKAYEEKFSSQQNQNLLMRVIEELKKNTRKQTYILKSAALYRLFDFLEYLANKKNKLAALIYKKIIFLFIQNHQDDEIRQIILQNFSLILQKFSTIPLDFLLDPFLKQLNTKEGTSYILNVYDIQFVIQVCKHPKMEVSFALNFLDYFARLYLKSIIFSKMIFRIIQVITDRFCQDEVIIQYCIKNTEQMLNLYSMIVLGKKKQSKQQTIINNQKKSMIIQLIKHYIALEHLEMNSSIKQKVLNLYIGWIQNRNFRDKGLQSIVQLFGDTDDVILSHKMQQIQKEKQRDRQSASVLQSHRTQQLTPMTNQSRIPKNKLAQLRKYTDSQLTLLKPDLEKVQDFFKDQGLGYKKKGTLSKQQRMNLLLSRQQLKPDPKVLQDLQKIKQKVKQDQYKKKVRRQIQQKRNRDKYITHLNQQQLFQRNLSLGYTKLPQYKQDRILFDFDTVKTKHLKQDDNFIDVQEEQERQKTSVQYILSKHQKYIKVIFNKYAYASAADKKTSMISQRSTISLSFTEIIRMLKDKGLNRIPKLIINQVMAKINHGLRKQKNILGGIYQQDFGKFLLELTYILNTIDKIQIDLPLGIHIQKTVRTLLDGQSISKEFNDQKVVQYKKKIDPFADEQPEIPIPQGYKKIKQKDMILTYSLLLQGTGIAQSYLNCFDIVDYIFQKAIGSHIMTPITEIVTRNSIAPLPRIPKMKRLLQHSTQKNITNTNNSQYGQKELQNNEGENKEKNFQSKIIKGNFSLHNKKALSHKNLKGSSGNKTIDNAALQQQQRKKQKIRLQHSKKLKEDLIKLAEQKKIKLQEQKKKKLKQQEDKKLKQQNKKKYLQENKKKIQQKHQKQQAEKVQKSKKQEIIKQQLKQKTKKKEAEMLQKQKKRIQDKIQKRKQLQKQKQIKFSSPIKSQKLKNQVLNKLNQNKQEKQKQAQFKKSLTSGSLKKIVERYQKQFSELFQGYAHWQTQILQLNSFALLLRDFNVSPGYIAPKHIAQVYKSVSKGQQIQLNGFIECLARLSYKSNKVTQNGITKRQAQKNQNSEKMQDKGNFDPQTFNELCQKLKMQQQNYKNVIKQSKQHRF